MITPCVFCRNATLGEPGQALCVTCELIPPLVRLELGRLMRECEEEGVELVVSVRAAVMTFEEVRQ